VGISVAVLDTEPEVDSARAGGRRAPIRFWAPPPRKIRLFIGRRQASRRRQFSVQRGAAKIFQQINFKKSQILTPWFIDLSYYTPYIPYSVVGWINTKSMKKSNSKNMLILIRNNFCSKFFQNFEILYYVSRRQILEK
jgi:hypothetical protein